MTSTCLDINVRLKFNYKLELVEEQGEEEEEVAGEEEIECQAVMREEFPHISMHVVRVNTY